MGLDKSRTRPACAYYSEAVLRTTVLDVSKFRDDVRDPRQDWENTTRKHCTRLRSSNNKPKHRVKTTKVSICVVLAKEQSARLG